MTKEQEFIKSYGEYIVKSHSLIDLLFLNLNPNLSGEKAAEINQAFHDTTDSMERMTELGKEVSKKANFPVILAN